MRPPWRLPRTLVAVVLEEVYDTHENDYDDEKVEALVGSNDSIEMALHGSSSETTDLMDIGNVPWVTVLLTVWMAGLYLLSPSFDSVLEYLLLSPWMHAGVGHIANNLVLFVPLGIWTERRVGSLVFLTFSLLIPYIALHGPVTIGIGELSWGASGLTKALTGYAILALFAEFYRTMGSFEVGYRAVAIVGGLILILFYLFADASLTIRRFFHLSPRPDGVSVSAHFAGLIFGVLWFGYRTVRYGVFNS